MPHVCFVPFSGFRLRECELLELGMTLPGLQPRAAAIGQLPALGLLTLAGMLPPGWSCSYRPVEHADAEFIERLLAERPALVAVSALTASVTDAYRFAQTLRQRGVPVVMGGLHVTACPDEARQFCDTVVIGDGEPVWHQILKDVQSGCLKPLYRATENFDLHESPVPRFDLVHGLPPRFTLQTQRGCPFACDFCAASRLLGKFREKPLTNIARELEKMSSISAAPLLELADDNTFAGTRKFDELFDVLERSRARYFTESDWRIGERSDILHGLARSGCQQVLVGIESLVFQHPGMGDKHSELRRVMNALHAIQEAGVAVNGCFIVGADGETRSSLARLEQFILDCGLAEVQVTMQTPFPGTALRKRLEREGRLISTRGWDHYTLFDLTYHPDSLSVTELETGFRELLRNAFGPVATHRRAAIRRRVWRGRPGRVAMSDMGDVE